MTRLFLAALLAFGLAGCDDDSTPADGTGGTMANAGGMMVGGDDTVGSGGGGVAMPGGTMTGTGGASGMGGTASAGGQMPMAEPPTRAPMGEKIGHCVLRHPAEDPPTDPYAVGELVRDAAYAPFSKHLKVHGITLVAQNNVTDAFMSKVAETIRSIFAEGQDTNRAQQRRLLVNLHRYRATIPLFKGEPNIDEFEGRDWDALNDNNSLCDIIMEDVEGQVMEVLEHILHIVTDVGMHHTFGADWGLAADSTLSRTMAQAIELGLYDVSSYEEIRGEPEAYARVVIQEYAYWLITTGWDVQTRHGPGANEEWTLGTAADLRQQLPDGHALYLRGAVPVMSAPSAQLLTDLEGFGP